MAFIWLSQLLIPLSRWAGQRRHQFNDATLWVFLSFYRHRSCAIKHQELITLARYGQQEDERHAQLAGDGIIIVLHNKAKETITGIGVAKEMSLSYMKVGHFIRHPSVT